MRNERFLKTWRKLNQAGAPTEPVRSHFLQPTAKIDSARGTGKWLRDLPSDNPLLQNNPIDSIFGAGTLSSLGDPSNLGKGGGVDNAISWFSTPAKRKASGENLMKILRDRFPEGSDMRQVVEDSYSRYPRTMAHIGDIDKGDTNGWGGWAKPETKLESKFQKKNLYHDTDMENITDENLTVPKLNNRMEEILTDPEDGTKIYSDTKKSNLDNIYSDIKKSKRALNLDNSIKISDKVTGTGNYPEISRIMRHELNHTAQNIKRPLTHIEEIRDGRGHIRGVHDSAVDLKNLDYMLEPIEVAARHGDSKPLLPRKNIVIKILDDFNRDTPDELVPDVKDLRIESKLVTRKPTPIHDIVNQELDKIARQFKIAIERAGDNPEYLLTQGGTSNGKKLKPSKSEYQKSEGRVFKQALKKIEDKVLPYFNKSRPDDDKLVFALRGKPINVNAFLAKPEDFVDFLREVKVARSSKLKK